MYKVFGMSDSGNCYKIKLLLTQLEIGYEWEELNTQTGQTRTAEFLAINPNGKVPTLQIGTDQFLSESNAILSYLADGTEFWPAERLHRAQTLQWMFFEQYSHEPYIAVARSLCRYLPADHPRQAELPRLRDRGYQALGVMEHHLTQQSFFVNNRYTIADIALFAYTHVAEDGGFDLAQFPAIQAWLDRVKQQPRFVSMAADQ